MPENEGAAEDRELSPSLSAAGRLWFEWWTLAVFLLMYFLLPGILAAVAWRGWIDRGVWPWGAIPIQLAGLAVLLWGARGMFGSWPMVWQATGLARWRWVWLGQGILLSAGIALLAGAVTLGWRMAMHRLGVDFELPGTLRFFKEGSNSQIAAFALMAIGLAPVFEELAFRNALFGLLRRVTGFWPAALATGGLFALSHGSGLQFPGLVVMAVCWQWINRRSGSLWSSILLHFFNNFFAVAILWVAVYFKIAVFE